MITVGQVLELWRYPVSSLAGQRLDDANLDVAGVEGDRIAGMFDAADGAIAQPDSEKRWRVAPQIQSRLRGAEIEISVDGNAWYRMHSAEARALADAVTGFAVDFRRYGTSVGDGEQPRYQRTAIHLLTTASLCELARHMPDADQIDRRRFRPNIVVETLPELSGYCEKEWVGRTLAVGSTTIEIVEPCERCSFVALAQEGLAFAPSVLHAITRQGGGYGVLAEVTGAGAIKVGDPITLN